MESIGTIPKLSAGGLAAPLKGRRAAIQEKRGRRHPLLRLRLLEFAVPLVDLALGFFLRDAVPLLNLSCQHLLVAFRLGQVVIGKFAPLTLHLAFELLPIADYLIPVHGISS